MKKVCVFLTIVDGDKMDGIILVNKPIGMTSHDVVNQLRRILHTKKIGHCGTLDPMATGLLVVCVNKATKVLQFLMNDEKVYTAALALGKMTDTYDQEGKVIEEKDVPILTKEEVTEVLNSFLGESMQVPPMYSALKVNGKKLYEYAREGKQVEVEPRKIVIHEIELVSYQDSEIVFRCRCSKGTYIRSLCVDIASRLGTVGYMSALNREQVGVFSLEDSSTLEEIEAGNYRLISLEKALSGYQSLMIEDENIVYHGKKIHSDLEGLVVIKNKEGKVLAMYQQAGMHTLKNVRGLW